MNLQAALETYLGNLERELAREDTRPRIVAREADPLARVYDLLGETEKSRQYFQLAAENMLKILENEMFGEPDHRGNDLLKAARFLWWLEDPRANEYFSKALQEYVKCHASEFETTRGWCWRLSAYCLIFLEEYEKALDAAQADKELHRITKTKRDPERQSDILVEIVEQLIEKDYNQVRQLAEEYFKIAKLAPYSQMTLPIVDIPELAKRKLAAARKN